MKERQCTFSKQICIEKYGDKKGIKIFNKRQNKWNDSLNKNGNMKGGFSRISQELFFNILKYYNNSEQENIYFAIKNREFKLNDDNNTVYLYDFTDIKKKKIIEYNGDLYHANPKMFESNDNPHPFRKKLTSQEIWDKDEKKLFIAKKEGFDILVIWDKDYKNNKGKILKKCLEFLG